MQDYKSVTELVRKYKGAVDAKEQELTKLKEALTSLENTLLIMEREGSYQESLPMEDKLPDEVKTDQFKNMKLNESLLVVLRSGNGEGMTSREIYNKIMAGGYSTASKNKKQDVIVGLYRLEKRGQITSTKKENIKHYTIKEN